MTTSKTKTINVSSSYSSHASPNIGYPTGMPQGSRHICSWRYMVDGSPPAPYNRGYGVVPSERIPRPYENLQQAENTPYQQVWYGCPEEVIILRLIGALSPTNARANHIHLLDTATTLAWLEITRGWCKLRQIQPSLDQDGQDWCWMGMGWLEG